MLLYQIWTIKNQNWSNGSLFKFVMKMFLSNGITWQLFAFEFSRGFWSEQMAIWQNRLQNFRNSWLSWKKCFFKHMQHCYFKIKSILFIYLTLEKNQEIIYVSTLFFSSRHSIFLLTYFYFVSCLDFGDSIVVTFTYCVLTLCQLKRQLNMKERWFKLLYLVVTWKLF